MSVRRHAAANAKTKGILGKMLQTKDYQLLIKMETLDEFFDYLRSDTHYREVLINCDNDKSLCFKQMKVHFIGAYEKLYHFYVDAYRNFYKAMLLRYEIENLKLYLRAVMRSEKVSIDSLNGLSVNKLNKLNLEKMASATTVSEVLECIRDKKYYKSLVTFSEDDPVKMLFHMEMVLDRHYFNTLQLAVRDLEKSDREALLVLLGINIDILNIQWILRGRKYFDISPEELFNFTLNGGKNYDYKQLKAFCYMPLDVFIQNVISSEYGDIVEDTEYMLERAMERHIYKELKKYLKHAKLSVVLPVIMLFMFEYELRDLYTISEAIDSGYGQVEELLIRNLKEVR